MHNKNLQRVNRLLLLDGAGAPESWGQLARTIACAFVVLACAYMWLLAVVLLFG